MDESVSVFFSCGNPLKQIVAIVKPYLAEKVIRAIASETIEEINIREVKGYGSQKNYLDRYGENEYSLAFVPKVEISVWVDDEWVDSLVDCIIEVSRTGRLGDGKILILPIAQSAGFLF